VDSDPVWIAPAAATGASTHVSRPPRPRSRACPTGTRLGIVVETSNRPARDLYRRLGSVRLEPEIFQRDLPYVR